MKFARGVIKTFRKYTEGSLPFSGAAPVLEESGIHPCDFSEEAKTYFRKLVISTLVYFVVWISAVTLAFAAAVLLFVLGGSIFKIGIAGIHLMLIVSLSAFIAMWNDIWLLTPLRKNYFIPVMIFAVTAVSICFAVPAALWVLAILPASSCAKILKKHKAPKLAIWLKGMLFAGAVSGLAATAAVAFGTRWSRGIAIAAVVFACAFMILMIISALEACHHLAGDVPYIVRTDNRMTAVGLHSAAKPNSAVIGVISAVIIAVVFTGLALYSEYRIHREIDDREIYGADGETAVYVSDSTSDETPAQR